MKGLLECIPLLTLQVKGIDRAKHLSPPTLLCVAAVLSFSTIAKAGSARDYLNAPIDLLTTYNASYSASVTPEDGTDISSRSRSNVFGQSLVITRTMDYWGRTGGLSIVLPYAFANTSSGTLRASTNGVSDIGFLWQMNIFGGPALTRTIPDIRSADFLEFSSLRWNSNRHLQCYLTN